MYPWESIPRGASLELLRKYSSQASVWLRVDSWLLVAEGKGVKVSGKACTEVVNQLQAEQVAQKDMDELKLELLACFSNCAAKLRLK